SAHWLAVPPAPLGPPPPPLSTEPRPYVAMSVLLRMWVLPPCVIGPAFWARVILDRQSAVETQPAAADAAGAQAGIRESAPSVAISPTAPSRTRRHRWGVLARAGRGL